MNFVLVILVLFKFNEIYLAPLASGGHGTLDTNMTKQENDTKQLSDVDKRTDPNSPNAQFDNSTLRVKAVGNDSKFILFSEGNWTHGTINIGSKSAEDFYPMETIKLDQILKTGGNQIQNDFGDPAHPRSVINVSVVDYDTMSKYDARYNMTRIAKVLEAKVSEGQDRYLCTPILEDNNELFVSDDFIMTLEGSVANKTGRRPKFLVQNITSTSRDGLEHGRSIISVCTIIPISNCTHGGAEEPANVPNLISDHLDEFIEDALKSKDPHGITVNINKGINNYNLYRVPPGSLPDPVNNDKYNPDIYFHAQEEHMKSNENILRNILFELTRLNDLQWYQYISNYLPHMENNERNVNIYSRANPINTPSEIPQAHHPLEEINNMIKFVLNLEQVATEDGVSKYEEGAKAILKNIVDKIDRDSVFNGVNNTHIVDDYKIINQTWNKAQLDFIIGTIEHLMGNKTRSEKVRRYTNEHDDETVLPEDVEQSASKQPYKIVRVDDPGGKRHVMRRTSNGKQIKDALQGNETKDSLGVFPEDAKDLDQFANLEQKAESTQQESKKVHSNSPTDVEINTSVENYQDQTTLDSVMRTVEEEMNRSMHATEILDPSIEGIKILTDDSRVIQLKLELE